MPSLMKKEPKQGWVEGSVQEFLDLSAADMEYLETRRALSRRPRAESRPADGSRAIAALMGLRSGKAVSLDYRRPWLGIGHWPARLMR